MPSNSNMSPLIIKVCATLFYISLVITPLLAMAVQEGDLVCSSERDQQAPSVAHAGPDSYLIVWQDYRSGVSFDIYGAGLYEGEPFGPVAICTFSRDQKNPVVVWDGRHYLVIWEDNRSGSFYDIFGVRLAKSGALLDGVSSSSGIPVSKADKNQLQPDLVWNNKDCFLIVWEDYRNIDADIYGMRITADLSLYDGQPEDGGIALCHRSGDQKSPSVAWNGENFFVVWEDHVSAEINDIRGVRVSSAGNILDDMWEGGIVISEDNDIQRNPDSSSDGNRFMVVWDTHTSKQGYPDIYGILVERDGSIIADTPRRISTALHNQVNPIVAWTGTNYICLWKDDRDEKVDVYWTRIGQNGRLLNGDPNTGGIEMGLTNESCIYTNPAADFFQDEGVVVWEENYTGQLDLYSIDLIPPVPPLLEWSGDTGYESDGVEPDTGYGGATFTFRVIYSDKEDTPPQTAQVWIDNNGDDEFTFPDDRKVDMAIAPGIVSPDYTAGVIYQASVTLQYKGEAGVAYRFYFKDDIDEATGAPAGISKVTVENNPPLLSWCNSPGYYTDGVDPNQAEGSFTFKFMVNYRDIEGDLPEVAEVWIDLDDSETFEQRERFVMQEADKLDITAGRNYKKGLKILYVGDGKINYRFLFTDGFHLADGDLNKGDPTKNGVLTVHPHLKAPILSWPVEGGFEAGVKSGMDDEENLFIFKVGYRDPDNDTPVTTQVWVDLNGDGRYTEDERFKMAPEGLQDGDFTKVNYYIRQMPISSSGEGEMSYKFWFDDGWNIATGEPFLEGGSIMAQSPISLEWALVEGFITDGVNPDEGALDDTFEFRVVYINKYGYPPVLKEVWIDKDINGQFEEAERYAMEDANPVDMDYADGKEYVKLIEYDGATGSIPYRFVFSDIYTAASGAPTQTDLSIEILLMDGDAQSNVNGSPGTSLGDPESLEAGGGGCFIDNLIQDIPTVVEAGDEQREMILGAATPPLYVWMSVFKLGLIILMCMTFLCFALFGYNTVKGGH